MGLQIGDIVPRKAIEFKDLKGKKIAVDASMWLYQFIYESKFRNLLEVKCVKISIVVFMILYLLIFAPSGEQGFIYLQF